MTISLKIFLIFALCFLIYLPVYTLSLNDAQKEYLYGDYQEAIRKAESLRENDSVLYFLGLTYIKIGDYPRARIYLRKLLKKFPNSLFYEQALIKLSDTYFLEKDFLKAKSLYLKIKDKYPSSYFLPIAYLRLSQIAAKEGNWADKRKYLSALKSRYPQARKMPLVNLLESYGDFFTVQVGAFVQKKNALLLKEELEDKNYPVYMVEEKKYNFTFYKIRVGKYQKREEAEKLYRRLLKQGYPARIYP